MAVPGPLPSIHPSIPPQHPSPPTFSLRGAPPLPGEAVGGRRGRRVLPKNQSVGGERGEAGHRLAQRTARPYRCRPGSLIGSPLASAAKRETSKEVKEAGGGSGKAAGGDQANRGGSSTPALRAHGAGGAGIRGARVPLEEGGGYLAGTVTSLTSSEPC